MRKALFIVLSCAVMVALLGGMASAKDIRFGHVAPTFHGQQLGALAFAEYVKQKTNGELNVQVFPMGQLGGEMSMAEQVQTGTLEMASITTAVMMNFVPQAGLIDLPFVFPTRETAYAVLADKQFQDKFFGLFPAKGFQVIGYTENEFRDLTNSKRPVHKPEDVKGLKLRVMKSPVYMDTWQQLGASTVGLPFPEIYGALQQGVIDGQENPLFTSILIKVPEVNKFATRTQHSLTECLIIVNPDFWASLTPEQQKIFQEAADICIKVNREENVKAMQKLPKLDMSVDEYLKKENVEVVDLTPEERAAFAEAMRPVWDKYRETGPEMYDFFMSKIKEHTK